MTNEEFHNICSVAFGSNYTTDVSKALDISDRTVRAWRDGTRSIPKTLDSELVKVLDIRKETIEAAFSVLFEKMLKANLVSSHVAAGLSNDITTRDKKFYSTMLGGRDVPSKLLNFALSIAETDEQKTAIRTMMLKLKDNAQIPESVHDVIVSTLSSVDARSAIASLIGKPFDELFPDFVFDPEPGFRVSAFLPMHRLRKDSDGYRVSKKAAKYLKRDSFDDTKAISVVHNDEIIFISIREFVFAGFTEKPIPTK